MSFLSLDDDKREFETGLKKVKFRHILCFLESELPYMILGYIYQDYDELAIWWNISKNSAINYSNLCRDTLKTDLLNT